MILLDLTPVQYRKSACRILISWGVMIISDHFLFPYFLNLQIILHLNFFEMFFLHIDFFLINAK